MKRRSLPEGPCIGAIWCDRKATWVSYVPTENKFVAPMCAEHALEILTAIEAKKIPPDEPMFEVPSRN